jgi:hypothetical protein
MNGAHEQTFSDQERLADAEKSRRAREQFEKNWELEIRRARQAANLCVLCGRSLGVIARIGGAIQHSGCNAFAE